jgi:hypothetical protein
MLGVRAVENLSTRIQTSPRQDISSLETLVIAVRFGTSRSGRAESNASLPQALW